MDRVIEKIPLYKQKWFISVVVLLVPIVFLWKNFSGEDSNAFEVDGRRIILSTVKESVFEDYIPLKSTVEPLKTVYIDAVEGGRVEEILVDEGAYVKVGDVILVLSNTSLQLNVIEKEAKVSEQMNDLRNTQLAIKKNRLQLERDLIEIDFKLSGLSRLVKKNEEIHRREHMSDNDYEDDLDEYNYWKKLRVLVVKQQQQEETIREAQIAQLESSAENLTKNLAIARSNLENLTVKAPRSGRLTSLNAELGESKKRGDRLGQIDDVDNFKVSALVSEFYLNSVKRKQQAEFESDGQSYFLETTKIYPEIKNSQFRLDLKFIGNAPKSLYRGQTLALKLQLTDSYKALVIDNGPFFEDTGGAWVFVLDEDSNIARKRQIELGRRSPALIEIVDGLSPGEQILTSSYKNFLTSKHIVINAKNVN